jgi:hypothetical protein
MYQIVLTLTANGVRSGKLIACRGEPGQVDANGRIDRQICRYDGILPVGVTARVEALGSP